MPSQSAAQEQTTKLHSGNHNFEVQQTPLQTRLPPLAPRRLTLSFPTLPNAVLANPLPSCTLVPLCGLFNCWGHQKKALLLLFARSRHVARTAPSYDAVAAPAPRAGRSSGRPCSCPELVDPRVGVRLVPGDNRLTDDRPAWGTGIALGCRGGGGARKVHVVHGQ